LPNYNLLKLEKLSSQYSLEARIPYLDHRVVKAIFVTDIAKLWSYFTEKTAVEENNREKHFIEGI